MAKTTTALEAPNATATSAKSISNDALYQLSCLVWAAKGKVRDENNKLLNFHNHRFLKAIFNDWSQEIVAQKAGQIGFTTTILLKAMWAAKFKQWNILYSFPTDSLAAELVKTKVNKIINNNKALQQWTDGDSIETKTIAGKTIYFRGAHSGQAAGKQMESAEGIAFSTDLNIHDEADRSDQLILEQYETRQAASDFRGRWYFSNPTNPFTLSQKKWQESDQKCWFIPCPTCHAKQFLSWPDSIKDNRYVCKECARPLSDADRANGEWEKTKEGTISGYWINHLMCPWIPAKEIVKASEGNKQKFYNFTLGLPYAGSDVTLDRNLILSNVTTEENDSKNLVLGVDSGIKKHYVLGNYRGIIKIGVTEDWGEIERLIQVYGVKVAVFDALPDITEPRKIRDRFPGRVWLSYYKREVRKADFVKWDGKTRTVFTDRTKIIEQVIDEYTNHQIAIHLDPQELDLYIKHWGNIYKKTEANNVGVQDTWETLGTEDHFVHATCYYRIALYRMGKEESKVLSGDVKRDVHSPSEYLKEALQEATSDTKVFYG